MQYDPKDIPAFKEEVCKVSCRMKGKCINDCRDDHWFLMCPHYHSWKLEYTSFVWDQLRWQEEHPEEMEEKHKKNLEIAKILKEQKKKSKKDEEKL